MKLVWLDPSERAVRDARYDGKHPPSITAAIELREDLNLGLREAHALFHNKYADLGPFSESDLLKMIDILDKAGCSPELKD